MKLTTQRKSLLYTLLPLFLAYSSSVLAIHVWEVAYTGQSQGVSFSRQGNIFVHLGQFANQTSNQPNEIELVFFPVIPAAALNLEQYGL